ncbi:MAG: hypothetical protein EYC62_03695 [Alphaproteobacteria bacterium]|nr:MAG: hypothetical protein EYC62_03695 [Alphaproteobacteria bacterium]
MTINTALLSESSYSSALSDDRAWRETKLPSESEFSKLLPAASVEPAQAQAPNAIAAPILQDNIGQAADKTDSVAERLLNGNSEAEDAKPVDDNQDFTLADLIDVINPLQHIPVLGSLYRNLTGDTISGPARVIGGLAFGGPMGLLVATSSAIYAQEHGGRDIGEVAIASLGEDEEAPEHTAEQNKAQVAEENSDDSASDTESKTADASDAVNLAEVPDDIDAAPWLEPKAAAAPVTPVEQQPVAEVDIIPNKPMKPLAPTNANAAPVSVPPQQMPEMMMRAMDKYEQMMKQRVQQN